MASRSLHRERHPLSRSYGVILPSSLAAGHSSASGSSPWPPVSVSGTGRHARFSWGLLNCFASPGGYAQRAIPSAPSSAAAPSLSSHGGRGNLDPLAIGFPSRVILRARLTLIRLTLIRKPWPIGVPVSHRDYRYSCLHLLFQLLHGSSRCRFAAAGMLPYLPIRIGTTASVVCLCPVIIHARPLD